MDEPLGAGVSHSVRREGAPNCSRGGCAPQTMNCIVPVEAKSSNEATIIMTIATIEPLFDGRLTHQTHD